MKKLLLLALLLPCLASAEPTIFGLELGKALTLPKCPISPRFNDVDLFGQTAICVWERGAKTSIVFPNDKRPAIGKSPSIGATVKDGILQGLTIYTFGAASQESVFAALQEKFGKPSKVSKAQAQNLYGAQFNNINALWEQPSVTVEFWGVETKVDTGVVWIETPEVRAARMAEVVKPKGAAL